MKLLSFLCSNVLLPIYVQKSVIVIIKTHYKNNYFDMNPWLNIFLNVSITHSSSKIEIIAHCNLYFSNNTLLCFSKITKLQGVQN